MPRPSSRSSRASKRRPAGGLRALGKRVLEAEAAALQEAGGKLGPSFVRAAKLIAEIEGRLVVTGMGKAGFIAQKISSTFASTGTPSLFIHPADALHGDLGRLIPSDLLLALSHSGETEELVRLIGPVKRIGLPVLCVTASKRSTLGRGSDLCIEMGRHEEAGNGLAPTTSTAVMLGLGDALAMAVLELRGFTDDQFHLFHPGGALGRKLMRVHEVMRKGQMVPIVRRATKLSRVIAVMTETPGRPGAATVVDGDGRLVGMFTDGDLRRLLETHRFDAHAPVGKLMSPSPKVVRPEQQVAEAAEMLRTFRIDQVAVVDDAHRPVGLLDVQDLLALRFL